MGKALVIQTADFSDIAVDLSDVLLDKYYTNDMLVDGASAGFVDSNTGAVRSQSGYVYKKISVEGYSQIIVNGYYPIHIGAFYSSKSIGTSTYVSCNGKLTRSNAQTIATLYVPVPAGAKTLVLNIVTNHTNHNLTVKV